MLKVAPVSSYSHLQKNKLIRVLFAGDASSLKMRLHTQVDWILFLRDEKSKYGNVLTISRC